MYYLQSRYYDAEVGRFISADGIVGANGGLQGYNMFAYCLNNPVTRTDTSGADSFSETLDEDNKPMNDVHYSPGGASAGGTQIFHWNCTNSKNLMPSNKDVLNDSPMSFSTEYQSGSAMTTIESVNSTGVLYAVKDGYSHVSVYPIGGSIAEWRAAGSGSMWTQALISIVEFVD